MLGVCTVAAAAFGAVVPVAADSGDGFEFTLYAKEVPAPGGDQSGPPSKVGETFTFADDLYKTKGGEKVGRDGVICAVVRVSGTSVEANCVGTFELDGGPGGQLAGQTLATFDTSAGAPAAFDVAVTGGTGDFKNARGYIRSTPDGDYERMEFHINVR
ncbi:MULTISPECIES: dirigent protein [unclassified Streptomyces]|uniref:dirigent protein n=1 Tax=unclassified Streptomyces TaxID=2593676 RepID=UPI001F5BD718|nr:MULTISPECIES: dirigent protein [unclassified Streptomyces]